MAIKSQCVNCKHYTSIDFCDIKGVNLSYDGCHCQERVKRGNSPNAHANGNIRSYTNVNSSVSKKKMFQHPFSFKGRIRRTEYCLSYLIFLIYFFSMGLIVNKDFEVYYWVWALWLIFLIPTTWFAWAQGAKRCHDRGVSGWRQLNVFYQIRIFFAKGEEGVNVYGEPPK